MTSMLHDRVYPMQNGSFKLSRIALLLNIRNVLFSICMELSIDRKSLVQTTDREFCIISLGVPGWLH